MPQIDGKQLRNGSIDAGDKITPGTVDTPELAADAADATIVDLADTYDFGGGGGVVRVATPVAAADAAPKSYVDAVAGGLDWKDSVRVATTGPGTLATDFENGDTIDGIVLSTGDRILIKDQVSGVENGIYVVQVTGAPVRAADMAAASSAAGNAVFVEEGTANADNGFVCTNNVGTDVVGTDALNFTQFTGLGQITAGAGLTKTANTLDVGDVNRGVQVNADDVQVDASEIAGDALVQRAGGGNEHILDWDPAANGGLEVNAGQAQIKAADDSVALSASGLRANTPNTGNKNMTASVTASDDDQATATTVATTPGGGSYIKVEVNGVHILLGDGVKAGVEGFFSNDGGTTARAIAAVAAGDTFHWVGSVAGYQLAATDRIDFFYDVA
jgi:hypothetical protein